MAETDKPWAELEFDPRFNTELLIAVRDRICVKKFSPEVYQQHDELRMRRMFYDDEGNARSVTDFLQRANDNEPLVEEIGDLEKALEKLASMAELKDYASSIGVTLTDQDMEECKKNAIEFMELDDPTN